MTDLFTITWVTGSVTRDTLAAAKRVADNVALRKGLEAVVTVTETGWVEYTAKPEYHGEDWL